MVTNGSAIGRELVESNIIITRIWTSGWMSLQSYFFGLVLGRVTIFLPKVRGGSNFLGFSCGQISDPPPSPATNFWPIPRYSVNIVTTRFSKQVYAMYFAAPKVIRTHWLNFFCIKTSLLTSYPRNPVCKYYCFLGMLLTLAVFSCQLSTRKYSMLQLMHDLHYCILAT